MNLLLIVLELAGLWFMEQVLAHSWALAAASLLHFCREQRREEPLHMQQLQHIQQKISKGCLENQFHLLICCAREKFATPVPVRYVTISNMLLAVGWTPLLRALYLFTIAVLSEEETRTVPKKTQIRFKEEKERKMKVTWMKRLCMNNSSKHSPSFRYGFQRWERKWYS